MVSDSGGRGDDLVAPDPALGHAAAYLHETTWVVPTPVEARAVEQYLILTLDHGFNASTFTARVVASTGADVADAVCAALGALAGPLHGGAPSRALDALDEIGNPELAELKPGRPLPSNVEFYAGVVMETAGLPRRMFTPTFAVSRTVGWCAHIVEQAAVGKLIRPGSRYVGPFPIRCDPDWVPLDHGQ